MCFNMACLIHDSCGSCEFECVLTWHVYYMTAVVVVSLNVF